MFHSAHNRAFQKILNPQKTKPVLCSNSTRPKIQMPQKQGKKNPSFSFTYPNTFSSHIWALTKRVTLYKGDIVSPAAYSDIAAQKHWQTGLPSCSTPSPPCGKQAQFYPVTPSSLSAYIATELGLLLKIQLNILTQAKTRKGFSSLRIITWESSNPACSELLVIKKALEINAIPNLK